MALAQFVQPFYSPISAGSMAHVGAIPQANVAYHVVSSNPGQGITRITPTSPLPGPIKVPGGSYPAPLQPVHFPRPVGGPIRRIGLNNFVNAPNT